MKTTPRLFSMLGMSAALCLVSGRAEAQRPVVSPPTWKVTPVASTDKLTATAPGVLEPFVATPVQLRAARGEWECFQVVVRAGREPLRNVHFNATSLATQLGQFVPA
ncbi:MAG TPA: hypothetical protein VF719_05125, partial [Abditibacteriaceae bacterium]